MFSYMTKHLILKAYMYRGGSKTFNVDILEAEYLPWTEPESPVNFTLKIPFQSVCLYSVLLTRGLWLFIHSPEAAVLWYRYTMIQISHMNLYSLNVLLLNDVWQNRHGLLFTSPTTRINVGIVYFYKTTEVLQQCISLGSILWNALIIISKLFYCLNLPTPAWFGFKHMFSHCNWGWKLSQHLIKSTRFLHHKQGWRRSFFLPFNKKNLIHNCCNLVSSCGH